MAQGSQTNRTTVVPGAERALDQFKYEVARDIGVPTPADGYWGDLTSRQCGAVGGHMVRRMVQLAEQQLSGRTGSTANIGGGAMGGTNAGGTMGGGAGQTTRSR